SDRASPSVAAVFQSLRSDVATSRATMTATTATVVFQGTTVNCRSGEATASAAAKIRAAPFDNTRREHQRHGDQAREREHVGNDEWVPETKRGERHTHERIADAVGIITDLAFKRTIRPDL